MNTKNHQHDFELHRTDMFGSSYICACGMTVAPGEIKNLLDNFMPSPLAPPSEIFQSTVETFHTVTNTNMQFESQCREGQELFAVKNKEYGDSFQRFGLLGVVCQILGVVDRLPQIVLWHPEHGRQFSPSKLRDIFLDIHNFAVMALMTLEDGNYDGRPTT